MTTTGYPIVLPTSPEVRERLKAAGFSLDAETFSELSPDAKVIGETWIGPVFDLWLRAPNGAAAEMHGGDCIQLAYFLAVANILGIQTTPPPGMIPAENLRSLLKYLNDNLAAHTNLNREAPWLTHPEMVTIRRKPLEELRDAISAALSVDNQKGAPSQESEAK